MLKVKIQSEPIRIFCDITVSTTNLNGDIITRSDKVPKYGWIQLNQQFIIYKKERMVVSRKACKVPGYNDDLLKLKWDKNTRLNKNNYQIVYEESTIIGTEEEIIKNLSIRESLKRAWENGPILKYQNRPIIIKSYLTTDMSVNSNYLEHDNWDEIQEYIFKNKSGKVFSELNEAEDGIHGEILFYQRTIRFDTLLEQYVDAYKSIKFKDTIRKLENINLGNYFNIIEKEYVLGNGIESQPFESNFNLHFCVCPKNNPIWQNNGGIACTFNNKLIYKDSLLTTDQRQRDVVVHKKELDLTVDPRNINGIVGMLNIGMLRAYLCVRKVKCKNGVYYLFFSPVYYKAFYNSWFDHNYMYGFRTTDKVSNNYIIGTWYDIKQELFEKIDETKEPIINLHRYGGYLLGIYMNFFIECDDKIQRITDKNPYQKLFTQHSMFKLIKEAKMDQCYQDEIEEGREDTKM